MLLTVHPPGGCHNLLTPQVGDKERAKLSWQGQHPNRAESIDLPSVLVPPVGEGLACGPFGLQTNSQEYQFLYLLMGLCPFDPEEALV